MIYNARARFLLRLPSSIESEGVVTGQDRLNIPKVLRIAADGQAEVHGVDVVAKVTGLAAGSHAAAHAVGHIDRSGTEDGPAPHRNVVVRRAVAGVAPSSLGHGVQAQYPEGRAALQGQAIPRACRLVSQALP